MQTFLPYADFNKSVECLDYRRLGKQRIECKQILKILLNQTESKAWHNHPATKMWRGYEGALASYGEAVCKEWIKRGYKDGQFDYFHFRAVCLPNKLPPWLGNKEFHEAHRSNLLRKDKDYYSMYGWNEPNDLPYIWPIK